ncbi:hypothetical protein DNK63_09535 [Providencia rettgeri]|nr:hypothetical protein DNK63_09535 [Providencia rettgeri]
MADFFKAMISLMFLEIFMWVNIFISVFISISIYFSLQNLGFDSAGTALILFLISFIGLFHIKNVICKKLNIKKDN